MDYEKAYKEALKRAKELLLGNEHSNTIRSYFEHIFPELRESEDEEIRKKIVGGLRLMKEEGKEFFGSEPIDNCISYLEKQEQKPTEKLSKEDYVKKFKALCDTYEIKLPNREYDIYHLCKDLHKLFGNVDIQKPAWSEEDEKMRYFVTEAVQSRYSDRELSKYIDPGIIKEKKQLKQRLFDWLRDLRPSWKPNEEQMEAFRIYLYNPQYIDNSEDIKIKLVESLYNDLKRLM